MQDDYLAPQLLTPRRKGSGRTILLVMLLSFALGAALVGWLAWRGGYDFGSGLINHQPGNARLLDVPAPLANGSATAPAPGAATAAQADAVFGARLAEMEQRITRLDLQAQAASGNAARAEGLLVAFAARRMIERGAPLGYLEDQLRLRFADAQPHAVDTIIAAAHAPITLDSLSGQLQALAPSLATAPVEESGWQRMRREMAGLFVIRRQETPSAAPQNRLDRATLLMRAGNVDDAIPEVQRLPGATGAKGWLAAARHYVTTQKALDLIETAALLEPRKLQDADGQTVRQLSPLAGPSAQEKTTTDK